MRIRRIPSSTARKSSVDNAPRLSESRPLSTARSWSHIATERGPAEGVGTNGGAAQPPANGQPGGLGGALGAVMSDDPRLLRINEMLDEKIRPYLASDGGWLEIVSLQDKTLTIRYQGACGSCPSSLTGTLMGIESLIRQEIDPEIEVVAL